MTVSTLLILTILILRGGLHFKSVLGIVPCSLNYWYFNILALVVGGILIYLFGS